MSSTVPSSNFLSLSFTDRVISRNLKSCISKAGIVTPSTRPYFIRYASYTIDFLESRLDATEQSWLSHLSKYNHDLAQRAEVYKQLRQRSQVVREVLTSANISKGPNLEENVPKMLTELWEELKPVLDTDNAIFDKIKPNVSNEDMEKIEEEEKRRRLGMMKKDGHLWCATYMMRSLTPEELEQFPPGVPNMAKSAMLMAGKWQFSREFNFAPDL